MATLPTTEFIKNETAIQDLIIFDVNFVGDERGYYQENYQKAKLVKAGMSDSFNVVQNNISYNKLSGVTRGFHAEPWDKYISVITGKVFAAYVDLRKGKTFGKVITIEITPNKSVFLPKGVANSFQTLVPDTYYLYSVNDFWSSESYEKYIFVNLADTDLSVAWPIPLSKAILSDRDKKHPNLSTISPMESL
ncbi:MAG TPA: dTDP-4-dehydrorhamnose 3,5-epimerase [Candidatus Saccharimonadales bacterium]|nr:dTDP-4-dehydrorhamnose 3,5-epimerase [Candidatus Saccharimonadales bacterium]